MTHKDSIDLHDIGHAALAYTFARNVCAHSWVDAIYFDYPYPPGRPIWGTIRRREEDMRPVLRTSVETPAIAATIASTPPWEIVHSPWIRGVLGWRRPPAHTVLPGQTSAGRVAVCDRVDVASGARIGAEVDFEIAGHMPLVFRRRYSTAWLGASGVLGTGWRHGFESTLDSDADGFVFTAEDGESMRFTNPAGTFAARDRLAAVGAAELRQEGDRWVVHRWNHLHTDARRYVFETREGRILLTAIENSARQGLSLSYDATGRIDAVTQNIERRRIRFEYDGKRLARIYALAPGAAQPALVAHYLYDQVGRLVEARPTRAPGAQYQYDRVGRLLVERSRAGGFICSYDSDGRCVELVGQDGGPLRRFSYEPDSVTLVSDSLARETLYEYDDRGRVMLEIRPAGTQTSVDFDECGRPTQVVGPRRERIDYSYDGRGDLVQLVSSAGAAFELVHDDDHQPTSIVSATGGVWRMRYADGALVAVVDPRGAETSFERAADNVVARVITTSGHRVSIEHDADWYAVVWRDDLGVVGEQRFDHFLDVVETRDGGGAVTRFERDHSGRLFQRTGPDGVTLQLQYDEAGRLISSQTGDGGATLWAFADGRCVQREEAGGGVHDYVWDGEGRLIQVRHPNDDVQTFEYDVEDRLSSRRGLGEQEYQIIRPPGGRVLEVIRPGGVSALFEFDRSGKVSGVRALGEELIRNEYDGDGLLSLTVTPASSLRIERDPLGRPTAEISDRARVNAEYDAAGAIAGLTLSGAVTGSIRLERDMRGRLVSLADHRGVIQQFQYDDRSLLRSRRLGRVAQLSTRDAGGRLVVQTVGDTFARRFAYDGRGNVVTVIDAQRGHLGFEYDATNRLVGLEHSEGLFRFEHDLDGTPRAEEAAIAASGTTLRFDPIDQLLAATGRDGHEVRFGYDGLGRCIWKEDEHGRTEYVWFGGDLLARHRAGSDSLCFCVEGQPLALSIGDVIYHVVTSSVEHIVDLLDVDGNLAWHGERDPRGRLLVSDGPMAGVVPDDLLFQTAAPEVGLLYGRCPEYDRGVQRFFVVEARKVPG